MKRSPLRRVSRRKAAEDRLRARVKRDVFGYIPVACARCDQAEAADVHEPLTRARRGSTTDPQNMVPLCRACHRWVDEHQDEAHEAGWLRHSWEGDR